MTDKELLQMALEWVEWFASDDHSVRPTIKAREIAEAIKARLAQLEQDDGYCQACDGDNCTANEGCVAYDNPPEKEWVGLTDSEREEAVWESGKDGLTSNRYDVALAVEAKLKEKNT